MVQKHLIYVYRTRCTCIRCFCTNRYSGYAKSDTCYVAPRSMDFRERSTVPATACGKAAAWQLTRCALIQRAMWHHDQWIFANAASCQPPRAAKPQRGSYPGVLLSAYARGFFNFFTECYSKINLPKYCGQWKSGFSSGIGFHARK